MALRLSTRHPVEFVRAMQVVTEQVGLSGDPGEEVKDELQSLKHEFLNTQEDVMRIQSVHLAIW